MVTTRPESEVREVAFLPRHLKLLYLLAEFRAILAFILDIPSVGPVNSTAVQSVTLNAEPMVIRRGDWIIATWSDITNNPSSTDWLGLYRPGDSDRQHIGGTSMPKPACSLQFRPASRLALMSFVSSQTKAMYLATNNLMTNPMTVHADSPLSE